MNEIQKCILGIYKAIDRVCNENNIRYFAIGGTCLGAVRHHGFIPWDDDLDIAMPIEDYQKFIDIASDMLPNYLKLFTHKTAKHNCLPFFKVMDSRTTMTENRFAQWKDSFEGVWVDIMPLCGVPEEGQNREKFIRNVYTYIRLLHKTKTHLDFSAPFISKFTWCCLYPLRILPQDFIWNRWMKFLVEKPFNSAKYTGYVWSKSINRLIFPRAWFDDFVYLDFEDTQIRCPKGYHEFLTQMFGNYMEYPPENQRNYGHEFDKGIIDLKNSYLDYQSGKLELPEHIKV